VRYFPQHFFSLIVQDQTVCLFNIFPQPLNTPFFIQLILIGTPRIVTFSFRFSGFLPVSNDPSSVCFPGALDVPVPSSVARPVPIPEFDRATIPPLGQRVDFSAT
jgi:hypothetical protein